MKKKVYSTKYKIKDRTVYRKNSQKGWSIVIMPDGIRLDNFHGYPHIHGDTRNMEEIIYDDYEMVLKIVRRYIKRGEYIKTSKLREELVKLE